MSARGLPRPATRCVHGPAAPGARGGPLAPTLVQSTTYAWPDLDHPPPVTYARSGGPTSEALERQLADLEGGGAAVTFGSGLAAIDALLRCVPRGGRVVLGRHVYGGTTRLAEHFGQDRAIVEEVDATSEPALRAALERPADLVLVESPSNPTLQVTDLRAAAELAHAAGALLAVDNTLLTPLYQRPLELGADAVVHSTTKYLEGHNRTLGGAVVVAEPQAAPGEAASGGLAARLRWTRKVAGTVLAPFEAWLTLQGMRTLHLRTRAQWGAAGRLAGVAAAHPSVVRVLYPGRSDHPGHRVHRRQASGDGGLLALDLGSYGAARAFVNALKWFTIAENLGPTESLATHPASMTHADLAPERRRADGISDGLVRLSLGVEDLRDLEADLVGALDALRSERARELPA